MKWGNIWVVFTENQIKGGLENSLIRTLISIYFIIKVDFSKLKMRRNNPNTDNT